jgi:hypothetical protein
MPPFLNGVKNLGAARRQWGNNASLGNESVLVISGLDSTFNVTIRAIVSTEACPLGTTRITYENEPYINYASGFGREFCMGAA